MTYRLLARLLRFVVGVFFRRVEVAGGENIPDDGAVIFVGNHPNSLLDPVLIIATCRRPVHFAAKDVLFRGRVMRAILGALGAVPVARRSDHDGPVDNRAAFDALARVLADGGAMGIFPEGVSHDEAHLQRLKTGAARIALDAAARGLAVRVVPCGLNYVRPKRFRSRVLVQYGEPILVDNALRTGGEGGKMEGDEREAARALTEAIERALRALTVNADDWETVRVLDAARRLYQPHDVPLDVRAELQRRFNDVYPSVRALPDVRQVLERVRAYRDKLAALGLDDRDLRREMGAPEVIARVVQQLFLTLLWLPLAAPGIVLHAPLGLAIGFAGGRLTPRKDVLATTKLILGLAMVPLVWAALLGFAWWRFGFLVAAAALLLLALSGIATLKVLERGARLGRVLQAGLLVLGLRREVAALRAERAALERDVIAAVDRHRPPEMAPIFSRARTHDA